MSGLACTWVVGIGRWWDDPNARLLQHLGLGQFMVRVPLIGTFTAIVTALLPLTAIVSSLTALNLHRVVFAMMGRIDPADRGAHDAAYGVLVGLTMLSFFVFPVVLLLYACCGLQARLRARRERISEP